MATKISPKEYYQKGVVYDFRVNNLFSGFCNYCELIDEQTGVKTYLHGTANLQLYKGSLLKCKVKYVQRKRPVVELVDIDLHEIDDNRLTAAKLEDLLSHLEISWKTKDFVRLILEEDNDKYFESQCNKWVKSLIGKKYNLQDVRRDCSDLLELSEFLELCNDTERDFYQKRMTQMIEQIGYFIKATELIENLEMADFENTPEKFIATLFEKLRKSGFVYHPSKNFNILSCLFQLNPELMTQNIPMLLDIIGDREIGRWKKEPFQSALVKLLEFYIRECDGKIDKTKDNKELIKNNITALSIQLLLMDKDVEDSIADYRLNYARLCILSSYIVPNSNPEKFLDVAFFNLFNSELQCVAYGLKEINLVPHYISNIREIPSIDTLNTFQTAKNSLVVSAATDGIRLSTLSSSREGLYPVFPKELGLWKGLQVYLKEKPSINLAKASFNDILPYQRAWEEIEYMLFDTGNTATTVAKPKSKKNHKVDECVEISFISQDINNNNRYYCQIEDEIGGEGYIDVSDIVPYTLNGTSLRHFYASDGSRYVFKARILDQEDGLFHFSMLDIINEDIVSQFEDDDEDIICSLGSTPKENGLAPAVSKEGVAVSLYNAGDFEGLKKNSIVRCRYVGPGTGTFQISCNIIEVIEDEFDIHNAFKTLVEAYHERRIPEEAQIIQDEESQDFDKILDETYVREIIYLIDRASMVESDHIRSYNYLGFARILSMMIGWESQVAYYKGRMDIIAMLHYFAKNEKVDEERLEQMENVNSELFANNNVIRENFQKLQIVSFMGKPKHNNELYSFNSTTDSLQNLASLVLAYNIVSDNKMIKPACDIKNKIMNMLNLKGFESGLKKYGDNQNENENQVTEFKTSIIFPAGEKTDTPNPVRQMKEILKVIDSFLNTDGGTLYIGVNDSGYGVGLENDLESSYYNGDKDKYKREILEAIKKNLGKEVLTYVESVYFDPDNEDKDVLIVKIKQHPTGIPFEGIWYVRVDSTKQAYDKKGYENYRKVHKLEATLVEEPPSAVVIDTFAETGRGERIHQRNIPCVERIKTSKIRKNVLVDYMDSEHYVEPIGFFKFLENGKFKKLDTYDFDDLNPLTLTVLDDEKHGFLVLGYENGHIVKVSIGELLDYNDEREYARYSDSKLLFASIAHDEDAILTISKDKTHSKVVMRADSMNRFDNGKLMDCGMLPYNEGLNSSILAFEIIPSNYKADFNGILDKKDSFVGYPTNSVTKEMVNKLHLWGVNEI